MRQNSLEEAEGLGAQTCQGNKAPLDLGEVCFSHHFVASFPPPLLFSHCLLRLQDLWCGDLLPIHTVFVWES